jgi:hypothetical protein
MVDFVTAIATAGQVIGLLKELGGAQKAFDSAEWKLKLAEVNGLVADLKNALVDANAEARAKEEELNNLRKRFAVFADTIEVNGHRYEARDGKPGGLGISRNTLYKTVQDFFRFVGHKSLIFNKSVPLSQIAIFPDSPLLMVQPTH